MQIKLLLNNEDGSVIVLALIFLVLLTIMGMSATSTSTIEVQIAANGAKAKRNLYLAEAAAMEAVQLMEDETDADKLTAASVDSFSWLIDQSDTVSLATTDITNPRAEITEEKQQDSTVPVVGVKPRYAVIARGITGAASLQMTTASQMYTFDIYGIYDGDGAAQVVLGYKKRL